jgi:hypothetical protein
MGRWDDAVDEDGPIVVNRREGGRGVYVGRPSKWGNPFTIGRDGSRAEVIEKFRAWVVDRPELMAALPELRGRNLMCWCAPAPCHADVLLELANRELTDDRPPSKQLS